MSKRPTLRVWSRAERYHARSRPGRHRFRHRSRELQRRSTYASAAAVAAFAAELEAPLTSEADIVPALPRAMIAADERIASLAVEPVPHGELWTTMGRRVNLAGIGASAINSRRKWWAARVGSPSAPGKCSPLETRGTGRPLRRCKPVAFRGQSQTFFFVSLLRKSTHALVPPGYAAANFSSPLHCFALSHTTGAPRSITS